MSKTFTKITESDRTLLVVDSLNLAFRYKHSGATDFAEEVEPEVFTTRVISLPISVIESDPVESAGPEPSRAAAKFSCSCGIDHSA